MGNLQDIASGTAIAVSSGVVLMVIGGLMRLWRRDIERQKDVERIDGRQTQLEAAVEKIPGAMEKVAESFREGMKELHETLSDQGKSVAYLRGRAEERESREGR